MKRTLSVIVVAVMASLCRETFAEEAKNLQEAVDSLVSQVAESVKGDTKIKIAVLDLADLEQNVSTLGRYIAERSVTPFLRSAKFSVVERDLLDRTLKKLNLKIADMADPANVHILSTALGIQGIVKGSVSDLGEKIEINMRLVNAADNAGDVWAVAQAAVTKNPEITKLLQTPLGRSETVGGEPQNTEGKRTTPPVKQEAEAKPKASTTEWTCKTCGKEAIAVWVCRGCETRWCNACLSGRPMNLIHSRICTCGRALSIADKLTRTQ